MLNEAWQVLQALERVGTKLKTPHPLIQPLPASEKNLLRVRLNDIGSVVSVEDVSNEERLEIKRIVKTSEGSFPVVKVNQPFLLMSATSAIRDKLSRARQDQGRIDLLTEAVAEGTYRPWTDAGWKWANSLDKADILVDKLKENKQGGAMKSLAVRFKKALQTETEFILGVGTTALKKIRTGNLGAVKTVQELLVGKGKDNRGKDKKISVLLILELDDGKSIHQSRLWDIISEVLPTNLAATQREYRHYAASSAFGGEGTLLEEPFSAVKLPVLGARFPLISMASSADKAKCNRRYGLTEYTVCPVTSGQCRRMAGALEWLVTRKKGTTWQGMPSGRFEMDPRTHKKKEKPDLLIVHVAEMPEIDVKTASYFGTGAEVTEAQFEVDAKAVCDALQAIVQVQPKSKLNLFLIRKVSDGQIQIALARSPFVKDVLDGAERWQTGAKNIPQVTMYLPETPWGKESLPAVAEARPLTPYPDQVVRLLSRQWVRDGSSPVGPAGKPQKAAQEIVGPGFGEVLDLMLRSEGKWRPIAQQMLSLLIRRVSPLLVGVFGSKHAFAGQMHSHYFAYLREQREISLRAVAVFGILLDALESRKENYMKDAPYQVGQVLSLADTLHKDYCIVVRQGQLPNSLIGTSLMRRALDNPVGALADLSERIVEYIRWAKVVQISKDWPQNDQRRIAINEARKKLRQYQPLTSELSSSDLPKECSDAMKAQILLGFLGTPPTEEQKMEGEEENS
jgi:hypothetical protein